MRRLLIAIATALLVCSQANAWDGNPNTMPQWQAPVPQYHFNPQNRLDVMENAIVDSQMLAGSAIYRQRVARMSPEQIQAEREYWKRDACQTDRIIYGLATFGLYGIYSLIANDPC